MSEIKIDVPELVNVPVLPTPESMGSTSVSLYDRCKKYFKYGIVIALIMMGVYLYLKRKRLQNSNYSAFNTLKNFLSKPTNQNDTTSNQTPTVVQHKTEQPQDPNFTPI
jgi:hypothetical protein